MKALPLRCRNLRTLITWIVLQLTVAKAAGCVPVVRRPREGTVSLAVTHVSSPDRPLPVRLAGKHAAF
jgi:hypothetical protein